MGDKTKRTPLYDWHAAQGANMAGFGGYEMPLWYASAKNEHLAVLTAAGLFDTSHMALIRLQGPEAFHLLQHCFTNDLAACIGSARLPIGPGRAVYGAFLDDRGHVLDDTIIFCMARESFIVIVNAGMGKRVSDHLIRHAGPRRAAVLDLTDRVGKVDLQGPAAARILKKILRAPDAVFEKMPYFSFKGDFDPDQPQSGTVQLRDGTPILLSRTGYTGEFGFEIFVSPEAVRTLWERLLAAGAEFGLTACGLAARDSLRTGALLPLSHQDIGPWPFVRHPWEFALPFNETRTGFTKSFVGGEALLAASDAAYTLPFIGNDLRKVAAADPAVVLDSHGKQIGTVLTCVTDMGISRCGDTVYSIASPDKPADFAPKGLCCGFVKVSGCLRPGEEVRLRDNHRTIAVRICKDIRPARTARVPLRAMLQ